MGIEVTGEELKRLALCPLSTLSEYVTTATREQLGLKPVQAKVEALDGITSHDAASSAVAKSMLARMTADVAAYAEGENLRLEGGMKGIGGAELSKFFAANVGAAADIQMISARDNLSTLLLELKTIRDGDSSSISDVIPLLRHASNFVQLGSTADTSDADARLGRTLFMLKQLSRQVPEISAEFLFGATLSTKGLGYRGAEPIPKIQPS